MRRGIFLKLLNVTAVLTEPSYFFGFYFFNSANNLFAVNFVRSLPKEVPIEFLRCNSLLINNLPALISKLD